MFNSMAYKPFLIKKLKEGSIVRDSMEWEILVKSFPFKLRPEMKEPSKRDWKDQNGDDEFILNTPVFKAYTMDVDFLFMGDFGNGNKKILDFIDYLTTDGEFSVYDSYTGIGRTHIRYASMKESAFRRREGNNDVISFSITFKVNDPVTQIKLTK